MLGKTGLPMELTLRLEEGTDRRLKKNASPHVATERCINCGTCFDVCPTEAISEMQRQICRLCPDCANSPTMFPREMAEMTSKSCAAATPFRGSWAGFAAGPARRNASAGFS